MRNLAILAVFLCGCGPAVGGDDPVDEDWMLGTFSSVKVLPGEDVRGTMTRFELSPDGQGEVISVGCDEEARPMSWIENDDGAVQVDYGDDPVSVSIVFSNSECDNEENVFFPGKRLFRRTPEANPSVSSMTLYRSSICPGVYVPGDDCVDDGNECDPRGQCTVVWCEAGEPKQCENE